MLIRRFVSLRISRDMTLHRQREVNRKINMLMFLLFYTVAITFLIVKFQKTVDFFRTLLSILKKHRCDVTTRWLLITQGGGVRRKFNPLHTMGADTEFSIWLVVYHSL